MDGRENGVPCMQNRTPGFMIERSFLQRTDSLLTAEIYEKGVDQRIQCIGSAVLGFATIQQPAPTVLQVVSL